MAFSILADGSPPMIYPVDIVLPVWNRPVETRACLASLVSCSPDARIIMVNYGSERETERILEEFAEVLDERAILVSTERNIGRVAALNHGLGMAVAPVVVIVQDDMKLGPGWLASLLEIMSECPDVGLAVPTRGESRKDQRLGTLPCHEVDHGSLGIMAVRREMFTSIGGLDTEMDGGVWCLRDYSRRATHAGYRTVCVSPCRVSYGEPQLLGSVARREERIRQGEQMYLQRWGGERQCCFFAAEQSAGDRIVAMVPLIMTAARQGHMITILTDKETVRKIFSVDKPPLHESIAIESLPKLFPRRAMKRRIDRLKEAFPDIFLVDCDCRESDSVSGNRFAALVEEYQQKFYRAVEAPDAR